MGSISLGPKGPADRSEDRSPPQDLVDNKKLMIKNEKDN